MLSPIFSQQKENLNAILTSEKLENSNNLVNAVAIFENMTINDIIYGLNTATASDIQVEFASDLDRSTHTNNGITYQHLLSIRMISIWHKEVSVLPTMMTPRICTIVMAPQTLKLPAVQEIFT